MALTQPGPNSQSQLSFGEVPLWKLPDKDLFVMAVARGWNPGVLKLPGGLDNFRGVLELGSVVCADCLDPACKGCIR